MLFSFTCNEDDSGIRRPIYDLILVALLWIQCVVHISNSLFPKVDTDILSLTITVRG